MMKQFALLAAMVGVVFTVPFAEKYTESFSMHIQEKGFEFDQDVVLNEREQTVTVHVPGHNNVDETYFITDLKAHLTMKVAPRQGVCFLIKNDPEELPPLDVWRKTQEFTTDKVMTDDGAVKRRRSYVITEALTMRDWASVPHHMKKSCGGLPAMWTEAVTGELEITAHEAGQEWITYINYTKKDDGNRFKRQLAPIYIDRCNSANSAQRCVVYENSCFRVLTCETAKDVNGRDGSDCKQKKHIFEDVRCCKPCCLDENVPANNPSPWCGIPMTKEQLCPGMNFVG